MFRGRKKKIVSVLTTAIDSANYEPTLELGEVGRSPSFPSTCLATRIPKSPLGVQSQQLNAFLRKGKNVDLNVSLHLAPGG